MPGDTDGLKSRVNQLEVGKLEKKMNTDNVTITMSVKDAREFLRRDGQKHCIHADVCKRIAVHIQAIFDRRNVENDIPKIGRLKDAANKAALTGNREDLKAYLDLRRDLL